MVTLVDTSAWIEYLRGTESNAHIALRGLVKDGGASLTEPVIMEVLQGGRSPRHTRQLEGLLSRASLIRVESGDFAEAAFLYRLCRAKGDTIRSSVDCLIAAVAIRTRTPVLQQDKDFEVLARHTPLELAAG